MRAAISPNSSLPERLATRFAFSHVSTQLLLTMIMNDQCDEALACCGFEA